MIELTKINGERIVLNSRLIEYIVTIPETKIIMTNGRYHLVKEPYTEVINKVMAFEHRVLNGYQMVYSKDEGKESGAVCASQASGLPEKEEI